MMPDLGRYAVEVLSAYAGSLTVLVAVVVLSIRRAKRVRARLDRVEARRKGAA